MDRSTAPIPAGGLRSSPMSDWWQALDLTQKFFWSIAVFASVLQVFFLLGSAFCGHDFGHDIFCDHGDAGAGHDTHGDTASGAAKIFSLRAVLAFVLGFGWAGALLSAHGLVFWLLLPSACGVGVVFMWLFLATMRVLVRLRSEGNLDYRNAIGQTARVYVTIPPARSGAGQVEVLLQERLITAQAVTDEPRPLAPNTPVIVWSVEDQTVLVVAPAPAEISA